MNVTIDGVALDYRTNDWSTFSMSFGLSGGWTETAGCDSWVMDANVSNFSVLLGAVPYAAPHDFLANITRTPYPCGGQVYAGITGGPMVLQSKGDLFSPGSTITGYFGTMQIEEATWTMQPNPSSSVPEPSTLLLALTAALIWRWRR